MPRLVPGGPDVPAELIRKQEAGKMVFFCGAGVSVPTGLPGFRGLVEQLCSSLNVTKNPGEVEAIQRGEFDKALDSLEDRLMEQEVRKEVARLLSAPPRPGSLRLHRALLEVSRSASGIRLVTTNYDDNFRRANESNDLPLHVGPDVPRDLDNWNSVVHLHGRLDPSAAEASASSLVLTDSDFGRAYLRDQWASHFVSNLMDRYTVVFVGYSMADVVVRYLTKAVSSSPRRNQIYSLVGYADHAQRGQRESEWNGHRIQPILYDSRNAHKMLLHTAEEWAKLAADPHGYRVQVAVSGLRHEPDPATHEADPGRVVWAISDAAAVWPAFNQLRRRPVAGSQAAAWLHAFAIGGLLGGTDHPKPHERGPAGPVITARSEQQMLQADSVSQAVTLWIETHAHAPEVFKWVIERGRNLHFELRRRLWDRLTSADDDLPEIPPRLLHLWSVLLAEPPEDSEFLIRLDRILNRLSEPVPEVTDDILLRLLRPRLGVFPGPAPYRPITPDPQEAALLDCGHTEVILGCRDEIRGWSILTAIEPARFRGFLVRHAVTLTEYLKTTFFLLKRSDRTHARFIHLELADAEDAEGQGRRSRLHGLVGGWTLLIEWVRESYSSLPNAETRRDLIRSWIASDEKMLWRLALDAIVEDDKADFDLIRPLLLRSPQGVLWDDDCAREVVLVLREAGTRGSSELKAALVDAVRQELGADVAPDVDASRLGPVGYRLEALEDGGAPLSPEAATVLASFKERRDRSRGRESRVASALEGRIRDVVKALREEPVDRRAFAKFARARPVAALLALKALGETGECPVALWKNALGEVSKKIEDSKSRRVERLVELLLGLPDELFGRLDHELARLANVVAENWSGDDTTYWHFWRLGWAHRSGDTGDAGPADTLTRAMNTTAGKYAGAALKRIQEVSRQTSGPISEDHLRILDRIAGDTSGSSALLMLAFQLNWLYQYAPKWTTEKIISRMRWGNRATMDGSSEEVRGLWEVAVRETLTRDLVRALGSDLWTAVRRHQEFGHGENLVRLFVYVSASGQPGLISENDSRELARIAVEGKPRQVGIALSDILKRNPGPSDATWRATVRPWLENYWPKERALNTAESSTALVNVIVETGDRLSRCRRVGERLRHGAERPTDRSRRVSQGGVEVAPPCSPCAPPPDRPIPGY